MFFTKTGGGALDGALATINVNGSQYQLGKDASASVGGIAKLYTTVGGSNDTNTDGSVDQATLTSKFSSLQSGASLSITKDGNAATNPTISADGSTYVLKQGETSVATFAIAKDIFVREGSVVYGTYNSSTDTFTAGTADGSYSNAFIKLVLDEDNDGTTVTKTLYIPASSLVKAYTANNASGAKVSIAIDSNNGISASVNTGTIEETDLTSALLTKINNKADKVASATSGNFAGLDANGNLTDSGKKASDFQAAGSYKTTQTAKNDPTASGNSLTFIDTISQNANGEITATKKTIYSASASQAGIMSAADYSKLAAIGASVSEDVLTITTQA